MRKISLFLAAILFLPLAAFAQTGVGLVLGNPSEATIDAGSADNYLVVHSNYILSYNKARGAANWTAWHLSRADIGTVDRTEAFSPDTTLPADWRIRPNDYRNSGFDRGHLCPSKDRSSTETANAETFLMSNMQPQTPKLNQKTWNYLEDYTRQLVNQGSEAYVYAGCYGDGGRIKDKITIPTNCFKIIVVLPDGTNDLKRIGKNTRVIAVDMPNEQSIKIRWRTYLTTVDDIEEKTGYDFLASVPKEIQEIIEAKKDEQN